MTRPVDTLLISLDSDKGVLSKQMIVLAKSIPDIVLIK